MTATSRGATCQGDVNMESLSGLSEAGGIVRVRLHGRKGLGAYGHVYS